MQGQNLVGLCTNVLYILMICFHFKFQLHCSTHSRWLYRPYCIQYIRRPDYAVCINLYSRSCILVCYVWISYFTLISWPPVLLQNHYQLQPCSPERGQGRVQLFIAGTVSTSWSQPTPGATDSIRPTDYSHKRPKERRVLFTAGAASTGQRTTWAYNKPSTTIYLQNKLLNHRIAVSSEQPIENQVNLVTQRGHLSGHLWQCRWLTTWHLVHTSRLSSYNM